MKNPLDIGPGFIIALIILIFGMIAFLVLNLYTCKEWICPRKKSSLIKRRLIFWSDSDDISITEYDEHRLINDRHIYEDDEDDLYYA